MPWLLLSFVSIYFWHLFVHYMYVTFSVKSLKFVQKTSHSSFQSISVMMYDSWAHVVGDIVIFIFVNTELTTMNHWPFEGGTSFVDLLCFCSVLCLLRLCARLFICALRSPAGKGLTSWLSFVVSSCEFVTFPLLSWVRCGTWLYHFLIFAALLTLYDN